MTYPDAIRTRCLAAVERYGLRTGRMVLQDALRQAPSERTLVTWMTTEGLEPTDADRAFFVTWDANTLTRMKPKLERMANSLIEATTEAADNRDPQACNQYGVPMGISVDKAVGGGRHGGAIQVPIAVAAGGTIQLAIIAPAEIPLPPGETFEALAEATG